MIVSSTARSRTIRGGRLPARDKCRSAAWRALASSRGKKIVAPMKLVAAPEIPERDPVKLKGRTPLRRDFENIRRRWPRNFHPGRFDRRGSDRDRGRLNGAAAQSAKRRRDYAINDRSRTTRDLEQITTPSLLLEDHRGRGGQVFTTVIGARRPFDRPD